MRRRSHYDSESDDSMKHGVILQILIALVVSIGGAYAMNAVQVATIETEVKAMDKREMDRAAEAERAIERVSRDADARIDREMKSTNDKLEKIDANVQWLIKQQIETRALLRNQ